MIEGTAHFLKYLMLTEATFASSCIVRNDHYILSESYLLNVGIIDKAERKIN